TGAGTWTNQAASFDTTTVADGQYDLRVTTTDDAGNAFTSAATTIRIDNTLPTGSVTAPANGAEIGVPPVALTSDSADAGGSGVASTVFERSPAGAGTWTATAASWNTASGPDAVADGGYDLRVRTTDNAGNVFTSAAITVLVDHTAPATSASLAPDTPSNAPVTVSFSASDGSGSGVSSISYRVDGGSLQLGTAVIVPAPGDHSNDGSHLVEFFATDDVGNAETLKGIAVVIDTTAPSGSGGDPGTYLRGIANLTYSTAAGDVSSVQFQFSPAGAGAWSNVGGADISPPYEAAWNTSLVADGPYDLRAVVTDATGNVATTLLPGLPKTVDNTAPAASVTAPAGGAYVSGTVAVDASATDGATPPASGVSAVRFEVRPAGAGAYSVFGTQTAPVAGATYRQTLATTSLADGLAELRVVVTDVAGNETTSALSTINVDNDAPVVTLVDPGSAVASSVNLIATSSADTTDVTFRYRPVGSGVTGTAIGSDSTAPFAVTWTTAPAAEQQWELIAVATDGGGNVTTSTARTVLVDRTQPSGSVAAPVAGASVGGPAVAVAATAADTPGSGVTLVEWQVKEFGAAGFTTVAGDATAPYAGAWDSTPAPDGAAEIRALITDAAGNAFTTAVVPVTVDSTGPSVTLADPGAVLSGAVSLAAATGGGAIRVQFAVSPADAGTWTQIAEDATAPFAAPFDTAALADGLYDLRAIGFDGLGNASAASIREDVRLDNTAPQLVSATPADGSVSTSASQIVLTASERVTAPGAFLDGAAAPAPVAAGNQLTFPTGPLTEGLHVLSGELEDATGNRIPFRVAVTIESAVGADRPPVERSARPGSSSTLVAPGSLAAVTVPAVAWPPPPSPTDFVVLRVDLAPPAPVLGAGLLAGTQLVEVTARWALAGTPVTSFAAPIEIVISNPSGEPALPATSQDGTTWRALERLQSSSLPSGQQDGWYRDDAGIHILTRHLTWYALARDGEAPTAPRDLAGVLADDGLTLRWIPGTDSSGQIGNVLLYVNGEPYRWFGPTEFEAKLGPFAPGDTRSFTLAQKDAAGNISLQTAPLRAVPVLAGTSLQEATAALGAAGFTVGNVTHAVAAAPAGVVVQPAATRFALVPSRVDLVVSLGPAAPQTRLVFTVAGAKRITLKKTTTIAVRIKVSRPAQVTATLRGPKNRRLHTWRLQVKAGANVVRLRLPATVRRPGAYRLTWVAHSGSESVSRTIRFALDAGR
ncbi:MAG TPA: Ig-like domain-containing protein, partial [Gaiellaceae bacterium]|nr:Ig-like domain-containing protein [Gaiellaceae bacterium]